MSHRRAIEVMSYSKEFPISGCRPQRQYIEYRLNIMHAAVLNE